MSKSNHSDIVHSTMTELALMLIFVFSLFPAISLATSGGGQNFDDNLLSDVSESCLWIPDKAHESGATASFRREGQALEGTNLHLINRQPVPRSFLQIYWGFGYKEYSELPKNLKLPVGYNRESHRLNGAHSRLMIALNMDSSQKPYLYRNEKAREAVGYALEQLSADDNTDKFNMPSHRDEKTRLVMERAIIAQADISTNNDKAVSLVGQIKEILEDVEKSYDCLLLIDFINHPDPDHNILSKTEPNAVIVDQYHTVIKPLNPDSAKPGEEWTWKFHNTHHPFPKWFDETP